MSIAPVLATTILDASPSALDIAFVAICGWLVLAMQVGFAIRQAALHNESDGVVHAIKAVAGLCVGGLLFWMFGFGVIFGASRLGWFGTTLFAVSEPSSLLALALLFGGYCGVVTAIINGAVGERMRLSGQMAISAIVAVVIFPVFGHWVWGGQIGESHSGWLRELGFIDMAGSTAVHSVGGWLALVAMLLVRRRRVEVDCAANRTNADGTAEGRRLRWGAAIGTLIILATWPGLTAGALLGTTPTLAQVAFNTVIAGFAGGCAAMAYGYAGSRAVEAKHLFGGMIAGLVSVSAGCHVYGPSAAAIIAMIAGGLFVIAAVVLDRTRIEDTTGAVSAHAIAGVWGTIAVAIFADKSVLGIEQSRWELVVIQVIGSTTAFLWAFGFGGLLLVMLNRRLPLRSKLPSRSEVIMELPTKETTATEPDAVSSPFPSNPSLPVQVLQGWCQPDEQMATEQLPTVESADELEPVVVAEAPEVDSLPEEDVAVAIYDTEEEHQVETTCEDDCEEPSLVTRPRRVLVVDDCESELDDLAAQLGSMDCDVTVTTDPMEVMDLLLSSHDAGHPFDVLVADHDMPVRDGVELAAIVRSSQSLEAVRVAIVSDLDGGVPEEEAELVGIDAVIRKPASLDAMVEALEAITCDGDESIDAEQDCESEVAVARPPLSNRFVLIADDNEINQAFYKHVVEEAGGRTLVAEDGNATLQLLAEALEHGSAFDAVVLDMQLTSDDNVSTLELIREWETGTGEKPVKVIALTLSETSVAADQGLDIWDTLQKPVSKDLLLDALTQALSSGAQKPEMLSADQEASDVESESVPLGESAAEDELPEVPEQESDSLGEVEFVETVVELSSVAQAATETDDEADALVLIDVEELRERCLNDDEFVVAVLQQFAMELPAEHQRLQQAADAGNQEDVLMAADTLQGFCENVAAVAVCEAAGFVRVAFAEDGALIDSGCEEIRILTDRVNATLDRLEELILAIEVGSGSAG